MHTTPTAHPLPIRPLIALGAYACAVIAFALRYGTSLEALELSAFAAILVALSLSDLETRTIPNGCIAGALAVRAAFLAVTITAGAGYAHLVSSLAGFLVLGGGTLLAALLTDRLLGVESIGGGDIKLFAVVGFYFGVEGGLLVMFASCMLGALFGLGRRALGRTERHFPFGPGIALACVAVALV